MNIRILSLLEPFDAPVPMDRVRFLQSELAALAIAEARREGMPSRASVSFESVEFCGVQQAVASVTDACRGVPVVVLAPSDPDAGLAVATAVAGLPTVVLHQNLDPAVGPHPRSFRLGTGDRHHKGKAAAALLAARGQRAAVFVGTSPPTDGLAAIPSLIVIEPPADEASAPACAARALELLPAGGAVLLECGGARNRALARAIAGRADVVFLNGNPDVHDALAAARVTEVVGNLPERIGGGLASAVAAVLPAPSQADLDAAGMLAWRVDAVRLVIDAADGIAERTPSALVDALAARIAACDGRRRVVRGWHRPIWFDSDRRNACTEAVAAHVDPVAGRRVTDRLQVVPAPDGSFIQVPSLAVDVDIADIGRVDEAAGTFEAEATVRLQSDLPWTDGPQPSCIRVLNAVGDPEWFVSPSLGAGTYGIRGTFRFEPDLLAYPLDVQLLPVRIAAAGAHASAVVRAIPRDADIDCNCPGWRVVGGHRGVACSVRPVPDGKPTVVQGVEFGIRLRRARRDVQMRVALPIVLLVVVGAAALLAGGQDHAEMVAGILASLFLSAVALYFAEPKPSPGARTLIDAVYARVFVVFAGMLVAVLLAMRLPPDAYGPVVAAIACALPVACVAMLASLRGTVGRWRWRAMRA